MMINQWVQALADTTTTTTILVLSSMSFNVLKSILRHNKYCIYDCKIVLKISYHYLLGTWTIFSQGAPHFGLGSFFSN